MTLCLVVRPDGAAASERASSLANRIVLSVHSYSYGLKDNVPHQAAAARRRSAGSWRVDTHTLGRRDADGHFRPQRARREHDRLESETFVTYLVSSHQSPHRIGASGELITQCGVGPCFAQNSSGSFGAYASRSAGGHQLSNGGSDTHCGCAEQYGRAPGLARYLPHQ